MKFKLSQTQQYFLGILLVSILGAFIYFKKQNSFTSILDNSRYSIGEIEKINYYKGQDYFHYHFSVNNDNHEAGIGKTVSNNLFIGKRYFVIFEQDNPENSMLIPFLFVPDSITEAPSEGWKEPPVPIDKEEIREFLEEY